MKIHYLFSKKNIKLGRNEHNLQISAISKDI